MPNTSDTPGAASIDKTASFLAFFEIEKNELVETVEQLKKSPHYSFDNFNHYLLAHSTQTVDAIVEDVTKAHALLKEKRTVSPKKQKQLSQTIHQKIVLLTKVRKELEQKTQELNIDYLGHQELFKRTLDRFENTILLVENQFIQCQGQYAAATKQLSEEQTEEAYARAASALERNIQEIQESIDLLVQANRDFEDLEDFQQKIHLEQKLGAKSTFTISEELKAFYTEKHKTFCARHLKMSYEKTRIEKLPTALKNLKDCYVLKTMGSGPTRIKMNTALATIQKALEEIERLCKEFGSASGGFSTFSDIEAQYKIIQRSLGFFSKKYQHIANIAKKASALSTATAALFPSSCTEDFYATIATPHRELHEQITTDLKEALAIKKQAELISEKANTLWAQVQYYHGLFQLKETLQQQLALAKTKALAFQKLQNEITADFNTIKALALEGKKAPIQSMHLPLAQKMDQAKGALLILETAKDRAHTAITTLKEKITTRGPVGPWHKNPLYHATLESHFCADYDNLLTQYRTLEQTYSTCKKTNFDAIQTAVRKEEEHAEAVIQAKESAHQLIHFIYYFLKNNLPLLEEEVSFLSWGGGLPITVVKNGVQKTYRLPEGLAKIYNAAEQLALGKDLRDPRIIYRENIQAICMERLPLGHSDLYRFFHLRKNSVHRIYQKLGSFNENQIDLLAIKQLFQTLKTTDHKPFEINNDSVPTQYRVIR